MFCFTHKKNDSLKSQCSGLTNCLDFVLLNFAHGSLVVKTALFVVSKDKN